jgi:hypothetical protein
MGGMMAQTALDNNRAGIIVNGAVRDRTELADIPLGVKAFDDNPRKSSKSGSGEQDTDITIGGATFRPGATVYCDRDGILVERRHLALPIMNRDEPPRINPVLFHAAILTLTCTAVAFLAEPMLTIDLVSDPNALFQLGP